jgi:hypothetical protein
MGQFLCIYAFPISQDYFVTGPIFDLYLINLENKVSADLLSVNQGTPPFARSGHGFAAANNLKKLYVHGGIGNHEGTIFYMHKQHTKHKLSLQLSFKLSRTRNFKVSRLRKNHIMYAHV